MTVERASLAPGPMRLATVKLIEKLKEGSHGDILTDHELYNVCGHSTAVDCTGYGYLQSAIRYCLREHGVVWRRRRGAGELECLSDIQKVELANWERRGMHRRSKRTMRVLQSVRPDALSDEGRVQHLVHTAIWGTLLSATSQNAVKKLTSEAKPKALDMPLLVAAMTG